MDSVDNAQLQLILKGTTNRVPENENQFYESLDNFAEDCLINRQFIKWGNSFEVRQSFRVVLVSEEKENPTTYSVLWGQHSLAFVRTTVSQSDYSFEIYYWPRTNVDLTIEEQINIFDEFIFKFKGWSKYYWEFDLKEFENR